MGKLIILLGLSGVAVASLFRPWIGIVVAYLFAILTPHAVWYWHFDGIRPVLWILVPALIGFAIQAAKGEVETAALKNRRNVALFVLCLCFNISYYFGAYVDATGVYRVNDPAFFHATINKIFLLYFVACACIVHEKALKALVAAFVISAIYLTYWSNERYLSGSVFGRLSGPADASGSSVYRDENNFAMLFVVAQPFLWYIGQSFRNRFARWGMWLVIPFAWHAVFLTASRGGLVGLAAGLALMAWRSKYRRYGFLLLPAFFAVYQWQAGDLMKSRAATMDEYRTEASAATRLEAWETALNMIVHHPVTGVGLTSFVPAFPNYSAYEPREAHNTFLQITAEAGVLAGAMYLVVVIALMRSLWRYGKQLKAEADVDQRFLYATVEATLVGLFGLVVCSLFLSLQYFEIFYCLCLMGNAALYLATKNSKDRHVAYDKERGVNQKRDSGALGTLAAASEGDRARAEASQSSDHRMRTDAFVGASEDVVGRSR